MLEINPAAGEDLQQPHHKIALHLILNPTEDMAVMQEEIFGPLLPVKTYRAFDETIDYVNAHPRPLGLYYFGETAEEERALLDRTTSGGVTLNDVIMHVSQEDLPLGGVGPSGMGAYHATRALRPSATANPFTGKAGWICTASGWRRLGETSSCVF